MHVRLLSIVLLSVKSLSKVIQFYIKDIINLKISAKQILQTRLEGKEVKLKMSQQVAFLSI